MANPIERTSSIRGILAYTWFDPDRDFVKFFKNNDEYIRNDSIFKTEKYKVGYYIRSR